MPGIQWSDDLSVGAPVIDQQHKELFKRYNGLLEAMSKGEGKAELPRLVQYLLSYVETHFADEEKLMRNVNYPGYSAQKAEHATFMRDIAALKRQLETQGTSSSLTIEIQHRIGDWLMKHISQMDKKLGVFLAAR